MSAQKQPQSSQSWQWVPRVPRPLQALFDRFPLVTYGANELPARAPVSSEFPTLFVFVSEEDAARGAPSFNPTCLKWQTFLRIAGVQFRTVPSSNHASPTGALPFLLPPASRPPTSPSPCEQQQPIPASKLQEYALFHARSSDPTGPAGRYTSTTPPLRAEAYKALLDHRLRSAWLHALYLDPAHTALVARLYVEPASSVAAVRAALLYQLRRAAEAEVLKSIRHGGGMLMGLPGLRAGLTPAETERLYVEAGRALEALESLLREAGSRGVGGGVASPWFFGADEPGLFDAAVFTYVHLMLVDGRMDWTEEGRRRRKAASEQGVARSAMEMMVGSLHVPLLLSHHRRLWTILWPDIDLGDGLGFAAGEEDDEAEMVLVEEKFRMELSDSVEHIDMTESLLQA